MSQSKESKIIEQLLKDNNYNYKLEYTFKTLKGKNNILLRFDFAIFNNRQLLCLIEYDSIIHFQRKNHFHKTLTSYLQARERDRRKNRFCISKNIKLIRIPYWELKELTIEKIFNNKDFVVVNEFHNDYIYQSAP